MPGGLGWQGVGRSPWVCRGGGLLSPKRARCFTSQPQKAGSRPWYVFCYCEHNQHQHHYHQQQRDTVTTITANTTATAVAFSPSPPSLGSSSSPLTPCSVLHSCLRLIIYSKHLHTLFLIRNQSEACEAGRIALLITILPQKKLRLSNGR